MGRKFSPKQRRNSGRGRGVKQPVIPLLSPPYPAEPHLTQIARQVYHINLSNDNLHCGGHVGTFSHTDNFTLGVIIQRFGVLLFELFCLRSLFQQTKWNKCIITTTYLITYYNSMPMLNISEKTVHLGLPKTNQVSSVEELGRRLKFVFSSEMKFVHDKTK